MQNSLLGRNTFLWKPMGTIQSATSSSSSRIIIINTGACLLTHLIQFLHIPDDLSGVFHLQHCCSHHHSLLLVLQLRQCVRTMLLHTSFIKDHTLWRFYILIPTVPFSTPFFGPPFLQWTWRFGDLSDIKWEWNLFSLLLNGYILAWSVGFMNFPLLVDEVERRPIVPVNLLHLKHHNVSQNFPFRRIYCPCVFSLM